MDKFEYYWHLFLFTGVKKIDSLTVSIPSEGIDQLGIGDHSINPEDQSSPKISNPSRNEFIGKIHLLYLISII